jgi:class 3 adenylate cyclase
MLSAMATAAPPRAWSTRPPWTTALALALPLIGLGLLLARPEFDVHWEHHPSHFWLVLITAAVNVVLAYVTNVAAGRYRDARLVLVSLAFLASAGFLGLHALATPGVLLLDPNVGFTVATPIGLGIASIFAAVSTTALAGPRARTVLRLRPWLLWGLVASMIVWAVLSIAQLPPLDGPPPAREGVGPIEALAVVSVTLYAIAAIRSFQLYRLRGGYVLLSIAVALVLLAEAMIAIALSRNWHLSWWEWHILMAAAFAAIALGARSEYRRSGSLSGAFGGLYLEATLARLDRWNAGAIAAVAAAGERGGSTERVLADLRREGATVDEVALLAKAADEVRRLDAAFRPYLPSLVAERIRSRDPEAGRLGGQERIVSAMFADLAGFTTFSESRPPVEVIGMLNEYWAAVVPAIDAAGGVIEHFAGDGVMAIFNADGDQPDHARRAAGVGSAIVTAGRQVAARHPDWPIFRVGVNTGTAVVGNVGAAGRHSFAAIGDTTNTAARLMAAAEPGQVVVGRRTWDELGDGRRGTALGPVRVKGRNTAVEAWTLADPAT